MQRKILVVVGVNSEEHASKIKQDILDAVRVRATIYFVTAPQAVSVDETVEQLGKALSWGKR
ncbi:hypothetical protein LCGC14_2881670 [marine sediment metagenome]|uniref:Uncharacterized protein n=1 Tax=marine sediment metagenome TaxID=412755 RepID=A0A0F8YLP4_9ZZZZ